MDEEGDGHEQLKREHICHQWQQLEEMDDIIDDGPDAAGMATCCHGRRAAETVERLAVTEPRPLRHGDIISTGNEEGREFRRRAVAGELAPHDISRVPECFYALLKHLASPTNPNPKVRKSGAVGRAVLASVVMMMMN